MSGETGFFGGQAPKERRAFFDLDRLIKGLQAQYDEIVSTTSTVSHSALLNLADDTHTQYALADGTRGNFEASGAAAAALASANGYTISQVNAEAATRAAADTSLDGRLDVAETDIVALEGSVATVSSGLAQELLDRAAADGLRVLKAGDTMTGALSGVTPTLAAHLTRKDYVDAGDAAVTAALSAHLADTVDAHDASAVSVTTSGWSPVTTAWFTADDVQDGLFQIAAEIDGRIEAGDVTAIVNALNTWVGGDPTLNQSGIFSAGIITADAIAAGAIATSKLAANAVTAAKIAAGTITATEIATGTITAGNIAAGAITASKLATDAITSTNYIAPGIGELYSVAGSYLNLANGDIQTPGLYVDGTLGDLSVRGDITADTLIINNGGTEAARFFTSALGSLWTLDTGFTFAYPGVNAARTRGVEGGATGALGVDNNGTVAKFIQQVSSSSELAGAESYQYGTAQVYGYSDINTGYAEATLNAEAMLGSPAGSGAVANTSIKVIAVPEGYTATSVPYSIEMQGSLRVRQGFNDVLTASTSGLTAPNLSTPGSVTATGNLTTSGTVVVPRTTGIQLGDVNHGLKSIIASSEMPWCDGPQLRGWNGWAFYSSQLARFEMGLRSNGSAVYFWNRNATVLGSVPDDSLATHTLRVQGNAYFSANIDSGGAIGASSFWGTLYGTASGSSMIASYQLRGSNGSHGTSYDTAQCFVGGNGNEGTVSLWAINAASQFRQGGNIQKIYCRNYNDGAWTTVEGIISNVSSRKQKLDITTWPMAPRAAGAAVNEAEKMPSALEAAMRLRPVFYRWKKENLLSKTPDPSRMAALRRLNKIREGKGQAKWEDENPDEFFHDCEADNGEDCFLDVEGRCIKTRDWEEGSIGFIAEEVGEALPQAARLSEKSGDYESVDSVALSAVAIGAIQEQQKQIDELLKRIEVLEARGPK